jgi:hypothetical protein
MKFLLINSFPAFEVRDANIRWYLFEAIEKKYDVLESRLCAEKRIRKYITKAHPKPHSAQEQRDIMREENEELAVSYEWLRMKHAPIIPYGSPAEAISHEPGVFHSLFAYVSMLFLFCTPVMNKRTKEYFRFKKIASGLEGWNDSSGLKAYLNCQNLIAAVHQLSQYAFEILMKSGHGKRYAWIFFMASNHIKCLTGLCALSCFVCCGDVRTNML